MGYQIYRLRIADVQYGTAAVVDDDNVLEDGEEESDDEVEDFDFDEGAVSAGKNKKCMGS